MGGEKNPLADLKWKMEDLDDDKFVPKSVPKKIGNLYGGCGMPDHKRNFWRENLPLDKRIANKILYPLSLCRHHAKTLCNINYVKAKLTFRS